MTRNNKGVAGWLLYRLVSNYWSLAVVAVISAPIFAGLVLWLDRSGLTDWLLEQGLSPVASAETARDFAGVAAGVNAAFVTLYFSITLIVLSLAAGNLGVRLIDRWLEKLLVRVSISGLSFSLIVSLFAMLAIDADMELAEVPLGLLIAVFVLQLVNIAMLAVALHDLGRTMFVDTSIGALARDAEATISRIEGRKVDGIDWAQTLEAPGSGYVEGNDLETLRALTRGHSGALKVCAAPGQFVLKGEPVLQFENVIANEEGLLACVPLGDYRSDAQGSVFQIRLLVEIAARALSPAINDFYTAIASADSLTHAMAEHFDSWIEEGEVAVEPERPQILLPGRDFRSLFDDPLSAFRQAACDYPSVSIRMIGNYGKLIARAQSKGRSAGLIEYLEGLAGALASHAREVTEHARDREDIQRALEQARKAPIA